MRSTGTKPQLNPSRTVPCWIEHANGFGDGKADLPFDFATEVVCGTQRKQWVSLDVEVDEILGAELRTLTFSIARILPHPLRRARFER